MRPVWPYVDESYQVIFVEFENETVQDVVNGFLLAVLVFVPLGLLTPPLI